MEQLAGLPVANSSNQRREAARWAAGERSRDLRAYRTARRTEVLVAEALRPTVSRLPPRLPPREDLVPRTPAGRSASNCGSPQAGSTLCHSPTSPGAPRTPQERRLSKQRRSRDAAAVRIQATYRGRSGRATARVLREDAMGPGDGTLNRSVWGSSASGSEWFHVGHAWFGPPAAAQAAAMCVDACASDSGAVAPVARPRRHAPWPGAAPRAAPASASGWFEWEPPPGAPPTIMDMGLGV